MLEKWLFKKVELWVVAVLALLGLIGCILFGWVVSIVAQTSHTLGGPKPGFFGRTALEVATIPTYVKQLFNAPTLWEDSNDKSVDLANLNSYDFVSKSSVRTFPLEYYEKVLSESEMVSNPPVAWAREHVVFPPLALLLRVNDQKDERLVIFDDQRRAVKDFPVRAASMLPEHNALLGVSPTHLLADGSYIIFPLGGMGLYRKSACGETLWSVKGLFHHDYSIVDGKLYVLGLIKDKYSEDELKFWNETAIINEIDVETGKVLRSVAIDEIARKNLKQFDPLMQRRWRDPGKDTNLFKHDFFHLNKIDVLSKAMAPEYPDFPVGAWLLSMRAINLVMVVDPNTLEILWYSQGRSQMQHDTQFTGKRQITMFNNGSNINDPDPHDKSNFSTLRRYDFGTGKWEDVFDGSGYKAYASKMGNFAQSPRGGYLFNVATQGRYLEVNNKGELLAAIINLRDADSVYWTKYAQYLTTDQFNILKNTVCKP